MMACTWPTHPTRYRGGVAPFVLVGGPYVHVEIGVVGFADLGAAGAAGRGVSGAGLSLSLSA